MGFGPRSLKLSENLRLLASNLRRLGPINLTSLFKEASLCPGKPQMRVLASILIRWQELGFTRGLEVIQMSSGEDPATWRYFDLPVRDQPVMGRGQPYYMNDNGVQNLRSHMAKEKQSDPPYADMENVEQLARAVRRKRKVGLTTKVNQTGGGDLDDWSADMLTQPSFPRGSQLHADGVREQLDPAGRASR